MPFVFGEGSSGMAGYTSAQLEQASIASPDLTGVPAVSTPPDNATLDFPIVGGGSAPGGTTEKRADDLRKLFDARVEPLQPKVSEEAMHIGLSHPGDNTIEQVSAIFSYMLNGDSRKKGWGYVHNTRGVNNFFYANATLREGENADPPCVGGGGCADFAILMSALVESIGGTTRIILAHNNTSEGHAFAEVYVGRLNSPDSQVDAVINWLRQDFETDKIFVNINTSTKEVWLNLDWWPDQAGNPHPGGPFFTGDQNIVLYIRENYPKATLNLPGKANKPPKLISLTSDKTSPQDAGTTITWTAKAKDLDKDQIFYAFFLNDNHVTKWVKDNTWVWTTTDNDTGENQIEVHIRDGKYGHALQNGFDDHRSSSFNITTPEIKPIVTTTTITKPSPAAQAPATQLAPTIESHVESWQKTFIGSGNGSVSSVRQTNDGGYIIAGSTNSSAWLIKIDSTGNKLWDKTIGGSKDDEAYSVQQTNDGGYITAGCTYSWSNSYGVGTFEHAWLIKTDASGDMIWDKTLGGSGLDKAYSVQQTNDGGYITVGITFPDKGGFDDVWLVKTDASGDMIWDKTFGGPGYDEAESVQQTNDGGYIIAGQIDYFEGGDAWLIKTDASGNELWNKTFDELGIDEARSVQQTNDGGYVIAGYTSSSGAGKTDAWLIKTDASGNKLWDKTFGGSGIDQAYSVQQTSDGGYIIAGLTGSYGAGKTDAWLIKTDASGNKLWDKTFGGSGIDQAYSVQQTSDGGYIIAGSTQSSGADVLDAWLIKTDANGQVQG